MRMLTANDDGDEWRNEGEEEEGVEVEEGALVVAIHSTLPPFHQGYDRRCPLAITASFILKEIQLAYLVRRFPRKHTSSEFHDFLTAPKRGGGGGRRRGTADKEDEDLQRGRHRVITRQLMSQCTLEI